MYVLVIQSCPTLCDPVDCSPPGSSVPGILQARTLEWVAMPSSRGSSRPRDWTWVFCIAGRFFIIWATWEAHLYIYPFFFRFFSHINYYRILNIVPCAIQWILMYYMYMFACVYVNTKLLIHPSPPHRNSLKLAYSVKERWCVSEELQYSWLQAPALVQMAVAKATGPTPVNKKGVIWDRVVSLVRIQNISVTWQPPESKCVFSLCLTHTHTHTHTQTRMPTHAPCSTDGTS